MGPRLAPILVLSCLALGAAREDVIAKKLPQIQACYKSLLKRVPNASGNVVVAIEIKPDGKVKSAKAQPQSTLKDAVMRGCVEKEVRRWTFAAGEPSFEYPFVFANL